MAAHSQPALAINCGDGAAVCVARHERLIQHRHCPTIDDLPPTPYPYPLPIELIGKPEVTSLRTLDSATFDLGNGQFARLQEGAPLHYQEVDGTWQRINPAFQHKAGRWINQTNTVRIALDSKSSAATINAAGISLLSKRR